MMAPVSPDAWDLLTGELEDDALDGVLDDVDGDELLATADELLTLRALGETADADLLDGADDPDAMLDAALAEATMSATRTERRTRSWFLRPALGGLAAVAVALLVVTSLVQPAVQPVPTYSGGWENGVSTVRAETGRLGHYVVGNEAHLALVPSAALAGRPVDAAVFVGRNGGAPEPVEGAAAQVGVGGRVDVWIPITAELGPGTHTAVVVIGPEGSLDGAAEPEGGQRVTLELVVVPE